jgi:hypothetical protein
MIEKLINFKNNESQIEILKRPSPPLTNLFFKEFSKSIFSITGFVSKNQPKKDINKLLKNTLPSSIQSKSFYNIWLEDMSNICKLFCTFLNTNKLSFWLGSARGCKRYHTDMVPFRLLVTYEGQGTELLPNYAANRDAFFKGEPNNKIIKDKLAIKFINKWDIAIFKGGKNGILHRTPDSALKCYSSILMRLDDPSFLDEVKKVNKVAERIYLRPLEKQIK